MARQRIVNPSIGVRIAAGEHSSVTGGIGRPGGLRPRCPRGRERSSRSSPTNVMPGCTERQSGRIVTALRVMRYGSSSLSPGTTSDREEPAWDGDGFWSRYDVVRLHAPEPNTRAKQTRNCTGLLIRTRSVRIRPRAQTYRRGEAVNTAVCKTANRRFKSGRRFHARVAR